MKTPRSAPSRTLPALALAVAALLVLVLAPRLKGAAGGAEAPGWLRPATGGPSLLPPPLEPAATGGLPVLDRALARLATHRRLLVVAAHPDDEDTALLTLVSRGMGGEAAYLSLSRGEGGQNAIGAEQGVALGLLRTRELLAARAVDGGRQYFARAFDFGYTLSLEETLGQWPQQVMTEDVVRVIRRFKPQVVVSIFPGTPVRTHGQHQAAGLAAHAAYPLAGDPAALPQLRAEGLLPWTPQALYRSAFFDRPSATVTLSTAVIDPLTGRSAFQIAMASRGMHRSQVMGRPLDLGPQETRLAWEAGGAGREGKEVFAGIDTHLRAIAAPLADAGLRRQVGDRLEAAEALALRARQGLSPERLDAALPALLELIGHLRAARSLLGNAESDDQRPVAELIDEKLEVAETAAAVAAGVAVDATTPREALVAGETFPVKAELWNSGGEPLSTVRVALVAEPAWSAEPWLGEGHDLAPGGIARWELKPSVRTGTPPTMPYFLRQPLKGSLYDWSGATASERGMPFGPVPLTAHFTLTVRGVPLTIRREVVHLHNDTVLGEVRRPLRVVPKVEVEVAEGLQMWPLGRHTSRNLRIMLTSHQRAPLKGSLEVVPEPAAGGGPAWPAVAARPFELPAAEDDEGEPVSLALTLTPPVSLAAGRYPLRLEAVAEGGERFDLALPLVDHEHIRPVPLPGKARVEVVAADIKLPPLHHVGYVRGELDRVPEYLRQVGIPVELLGPAELATSDLSHYEAIIIGSRAYESEASLPRANRRLLDYVRAGGLLIVQYQQYRYFDGGLAALKLEVARPHDRVTDETAPVKLLDPADPVFNRPNRIGEADWQGWVQERGLFFAHAWDPAWKPLLAMADPGGPELRGSLLVATVEKGHYVYTGLAFFREIPAGVPGAFRLFANLLALGR